LSQRRIGRALYDARPVLWPMPDSLFFVTSIHPLLM
jgi:hypothetical protein